MIITTPRVDILLDDIDAAFARLNWCIVKGYAVRTDRSGPKQKTVSLHRLIARAMPGIEVDHVNGDKLDNRRSNLRLCSRAENNRNQSTARSNKIGLKGVSWHTASQSYVAQICVDRKKIHLGCFACPETAAAIYDLAARKFHGAFARTNYPAKQKTSGA